jgi:GWxTD domain-containing protein
MERLLVECVVRATVIATATAIVLSLARIRTPAVLHGTWASVVIAMLLLPLWTIWGPSASIPVLPQRVATASVAVRPPVAIDAGSVPQAEGARSQLEPMSAPRDTSAWSWQHLALGIYGLMACALLVRLAAGTVRAHALIRQSVPRAGRLTNAACASPVTVGWLRPVVILPADWEEWSGAKLDAVLAHEHAHVRRRDPLVQWLALLNRALFWFHPLAWWLERRLSILAEQASDDAVLGRGHDPQDYSEYLLEIATAAGRPARLNLAGVFMPGVFLPQRIRRILAGVATPSVSRARMVCAVAACASVSVLSVVATPVRAALPQAGNPSRLVIRPLQYRWIPPESSRPQPVSLEWMDGDEWAFQVQSIIRNEELVAYSRLETARQRDAFIARFWGDRDPSPGTPENEFEAEYTRRVQFASERFGASGQPGFGFDTDRGRTYLMFGSPDAIDREGSGDNQLEIWRYADVAGIGSDVRIRFAPGRDFCGHRIVSPSPIRTIEATAVIAAVNDSARHASVGIYPHGLTNISVPLDAAGVTGARYELRNREGVEVDKGEIGWVEEGARKELLSRHLPPSWIAAGLGCTHALPADTYTVSTTVRFITGEIRTETATFDVQ